MALPTLTMFQDPISNVPCILISTGGGTTPYKFAVSNWQSNDIPVGSDSEQLYIRQWTGTTPNPSLQSGWNGANIINDTSQGFQSGAPSPTWPAAGKGGAPGFTLSQTQSWSIIAQTGGIGGAYPTSTALSASPVGTLQLGANTITITGIDLGGGNTGSLTVTISVNELND